MGSPKKKKSLPLPQKLATGYLLCMFAIFPVFCTDGYFNIRHDRYYFYLGLSITALMLQGLYLLLRTSDQKKMAHNLLAVHAASIGPWYRRLSFADWSMLVFLAAAVVSTVLSAYPEEALWGSAGRNNGLILLLVYGGIYFLITRCPVCGNGIFAGMAVCVSFVSVVALLNFFCLDPLKMHQALSESSSAIFISTIGNKNLLSSYLCIFLPVLVTLFVHSEHKGLRVLYLAAASLGFGALMCADSDSGFLGMGAFSLFGLLLYIREPGKLKKYLLAWSVVLLAAKGLQPFCVYPNKGLGTFQRFFVFSPWSTAVLVVLAAASAVLYLLHWKRPQLLFPAAARGILGVALAAGVLTLLACIIYYTALAPEDAPWSFLRLDDRWGTNRGFMWRRSLDIFSDFSWKEKLLGTGPDTFYPVFQPYFEEFSKFGDSSTNAAHNEYLNYLITQGLIGLLAYGGLLIGSIVHALRSAKKDPYYLVFAAAVIGYGAQSLVNIAQPITTPLFFLFLALSAKRIPKKTPKMKGISYKSRKK